MTEIEAKFLVPDEATFEALARLECIGGLRAGPPRTREQHDTYADTATLHLYRAGYACRLRRFGERALATVKGLGRSDGALHQRIELEHALATPSLGALCQLEAEPGPLVRQLAAGEPLVPLFSVTTQRRQADFGDEAAVRFEMALDRATFSGPAGKRLLLEAELELRHGDVALLERAAEELRRRYGLVASTRSKFERGLEWAGIEA